MNAFEFAGDGIQNVKYFSLKQLYTRTELLPKLFSITMNPCIKKRTGLTPAFVMSITGHYQNCR
jgi:hypothetical protein